MDMTNLIDNITAYEHDELTEKEEIELFQYLIDTGKAWTLQGHYGRRADQLINDGLCIEKVDSHIGCPAYPNCDININGCLVMMGDAVEWYGHRG